MAFLIFFFYIEKDVYTLPTDKGDIVPTRTYLIGI